MALLPTPIISNSAKSGDFVSSVNIFAGLTNTVYYTVPANHYLEGYITLNNNSATFNVVINGVVLTYNHSNTYSGDVPKPIFVDEGQTLGTSSNNQYWCFSGAVRSKG